MFNINPNILMSPDLVIESSDEIKSIQLTKWLLKPLGIWPFVSKNSTNNELRFAILLQTICLSLIGFVMIPSVFHIFLREKNLNTKLALFGPVGFVLTNLLKYCAIIYHQSDIKRCIQYIVDDWNNIDDQYDRDIMIKNIETGRNLTILCAIFMYSGGMLYHTIMPFLMNNPIGSDKNTTNSPIVYPGYDAAFNPYVTPIYEFIFFTHCIVAMIIYTITTVSCNLAASFVTHACGQIQIIIAKLNALIGDRSLSENCLHQRMASIIRYHVKVLRFTGDIEEILREICLVEVVASTLIICLLEYYCMTTWNESETIGICTYFLLLISLSFNIFIFCYIGELLEDQFSETGTATYMTEWYQLSPNNAIALVLIIATAQIPRKITAGGLIDLSLSSFASVIKTSLVYLNLLRTVEA